MSAESKSLPPGGLPAPVLLNDQQFTALLARHGVLTNDQVDRIVGAIRLRHELTPAQETTSNAVNDVGRRMGIKDFSTIPPPLVRRDNVVPLTVPRGTRVLRVYRAAGVEDRVIDASQPYVSLPACTGAADRIGRIEFLDERERVLEVTGGEPAPPRDGMGPARQTATDKGSE